MNLLSMQLSFPLKELSQEAAKVPFMKEKLGRLHHVMYMYIMMYGGAQRGAQVFVHNRRCCCCVGLEPDRGCCGQSVWGGAPSSHAETGGQLVP